MHTRLNRSSIYGAVTAVLVIWLALYCYQTLKRVIGMYDPVPNWDYWDILTLLSQHGQLRPAELWRQHNDHRIVFPQIVFAADLLWAHGRHILPLCMNLLCYVFVWFGLNIAVAKDKCVPFGDRMAAAILSGIVCSWESSSFVLAVPFLLQWTLTSAAGVATLLAITSAGRSRRALAGAIAAAVVATYSSGNGMLIWPVLIGASFILNVSPRRKAVIASAGAVAVALYFVNYHFSGTAGAPVFFAHPLYTMGWIAVYMAMPVALIGKIELQLFIGLASLIVVIASAVFSFRRGLLNSETAVVLFGYYLFTVLTAALTAAGRAIPIDNTFQNATAFRYVSVPQQAWAALILICVWAVSRAKWARFSPALVNAIYAVFLLLTLPRTTEWIRSNDLWWFSQEQLDSLAVQSDIFDPKLLRRVFGDPDSVVERCRMLRSLGLSIYSPGSQSLWLGKQLNAFKKVGKVFAPGAITYSFPVQSGIEIAGWAERSRRSLRPQKLVLANEDGKIVGFGSTFGIAMPPNFPSFSVPESNGWFGFANLSYGGKRVFAYLIRGDHVDPIAGLMAVQEMCPIAHAAAGPALSGVDWPAGDKWTSALPPNIETGSTPQGRFYASWNGSNSNVGELASSAFKAPACLVLPVLHGGLKAGLSIEIKDATTGDVIATVPLEDNDFYWEYWRIPLHSDARPIQIVASDRSKTWGGWIAVASPLECPPSQY